MKYTIRGTFEEKKVTSGGTSAIPIKNDFLENSSRELDAVENKISRFTTTRNELEVFCWGIVTGFFLGAILLWIM